MIYVCNIYREDEETITGRGSSAEEAKQNCFEKLAPELEIMVELVNGVTLPLKEAEKMPTQLPQGCQLVIFERSNHCGGWAYSWRYFAVRFGYHELGGRDRPVEVTRNPVRISTMDSNSDITYPLPVGSKEYVDGQWLPSSGVAYDY